MLKNFQRWRAQRRADREAVRQSERFLRAFDEGDSEVIRAMVARRYGRFFPLASEAIAAHIARMERVQRMIEDDDK